MTTNPTLRELIAAATPGPYFVGHDDKDMNEDYHAHVRSGLAVVDTGRDTDWPVARFCTWPQAQLIARLSPQTMLAVLEALELAIETIELDWGEGSAEKMHRALQFLNTPGGVKE